MTTPYTPDTPTQFDPAAETAARLREALNGPQMSMGVGPGATRRDEWYVLGWADARTRAIEIVDAALTAAPPVPASDEVARLTAQLAAAEQDAARLRGAVERARDVLDEETLIELNWKEAQRVGHRLRAALATGGVDGEVE